MKQILGIDVGGSKIASGLVDPKLKISKVRITPTSQADLLEQLTRRIASYQGFEAIAVAMPGVVKSNGFIQNLPNVKGFPAINLKSYLKKKFRLPVQVINDAQAFALAEAIVGAGKEAQTVLGVILGTGIGSGLVRNKKIQPPRGPVGGEIGRVRMGKLTLEQIMQQRGNSAKQLEPIMRAIIMLATRYADPEIIVFGGGRTNYPRMQQLTKRLNLKARISKLKHAGILGAALTVLKK